VRVELNYVGAFWGVAGKSLKKKKHTIEDNIEMSRSFLIFSSFNKYGNPICTIACAFSSLLEQ
jgi:hypothetical protein